MLQNLIHIVILWLLVEINCQTAPFKPPQRYLHTATFIENKLYVLGGRFDEIETVGKGFFCLDLSGPSDTQNLLWQDLSSINNIPTHRSAASVKGGVNNNTLFLYGGNSTNNEIASLYTFDPQSNSWTIPEIAGENVTSKFSLTGIVDYNGVMYLWGGQKLISEDYVNDMLILDTMNLRWEERNFVDAPTPRRHYGATLLSNNKIIYTGGYDGIGNSNDIPNNELSLNEVYIYDLINNSWTTQITSGSIPTKRHGFSAVLGLNGQIMIIFGGASASVVKNVPIPPRDSLYVLNLADYKWSIPTVTGPIPNSRVFHKANVIGKYMVVSFGQNYDQLTENDILLLDISNNNEYVWTYTFDPSPPTTMHNPDKTTVIIGATIGLLFGIALLLSGGFFLYRLNRNKRIQNDSFHSCDYF